MQKYFFILLKEDLEKDRSNDTHRIEFVDKSTESVRRIKDLEDELKETKQNLQSVVEELETSNEELQSSNEELISANEELQSTNEELQSLNEELHTVNTEHQLKIKELIELNDDLNNFFRSTDIGQVFLDNNLIIRKFTPASKDLINLIESDVGRPITHISNNLKNENLLRDIYEVSNTGELIEKEIELKNGKFYLTRLLPYVRQDKRIDGIVITFVDITDLKNLNSLLSGVLYSSLSGIIALKPIFSINNKIIDFEFLLSNHAAEDLLGKSELAGKRLLETFPNYRENKLFAKYVKVYEKEQIFHDEYIYNNQKDSFWIETVAVKMDTGIAVTLTNIHDKKIAEEKSQIAYQELKKVKENLLLLNNKLEERVQSRTRELAQSEERFRLISQATNDVVWDWNLVTKERWWNDGEKQSKIEFWSERIHPQDKDRVLKSIYDAINYGSSLWSCEYKFQRANGTYAYILDRGEVLHDENGVPYRMLGSMVDLSESKKAEEAMFAKNKELIKINELLDTFVYTAAHDLKSPVANLKILVDLLKEKGETGRKDLLAAIDLSVKRLDNTINGLVEIVEARSVDTEKIKKIKIEDMVKQILDENKNQIQDKKVEISYDFSEVNSITYIEAYLLSILHNLISNAIKYGPKDKTTVIKMKTWRENDFVVFSIEDNGIGMDLQKYGKNLFKPFNRFAKHIDGTGIGLYLIRNMVENNDGRIEVESKVNEGTTFRVKLREYGNNDQ
jgi:two-component system CheB/CheR fusion protein